MRLSNLKIGILCIGLMASCKTKDKNTAAEVNHVEKPILPLLPVEQQAYLYENAEYIDYIFHSLPYSLNQSEKPSIQSNIAGISRDPVYGRSCQAMGRMFFQVKGEIVIEADVYFQPPDCHYYIYIVDGEEKYANSMTPGNIAFYNQFMSQMSGQNQ